MMKKILCYLMGLLYLLAGANHFRNPDFYMAIMPDYLPFHKELILISGVCEIVCGLLLLIPKTRIIGAWATIALLIAVFPANVQMAIDYYHQSNPHLWIAILRLPLQGALIWWAYSYTKKQTL